MSIRHCSLCGQAGHYAKTCKAPDAEAAGLLKRAIQLGVVSSDLDKRPEKDSGPQDIKGVTVLRSTRAPRYVPEVSSDQIEYRCYCGYVNTYDTREAHKATHKK